MGKTIAKTWNGRKVKEEKTIACAPAVLFGALYEAQSVIQSDLYITGRLDGDNPIGFSHNPTFTEMGWIPKWKNLSKEDKASLDGVMVSSNFRTDSVKIIFFDK